jgi:hypothetical protein
MSGDFDSNAFERDMQQRQAARRADPPAFLEAAMTELWEGGREEDMLARWKSRLAEDPWYTSDLLYAMEAVADDPPEDLIAQLGRAGVRLFHYGFTEVVPYTFDEVVAWVAAQAERLRAISDEANA